MKIKGDGRKIGDLALGGLARAGAGGADVRDLVRHHAGQLRLRVAW